MPLLLLALLGGVAAVMASAPAKADGKAYKGPLRTMAGAGGKWDSFAGEGLTRAYQVVWNSPRLDYDGAGIGLEGMVRFWLDGQLSDDEAEKFASLIIREGATTGWDSGVEAVGADKWFAANPDYAAALDWTFRYLERRGDRDKALQAMIAKMLETQSCGARFYAHEYDEGSFEGWSRSELMEKDGRDCNVARAYIAELPGRGNLDWPTKVRLAIYAWRVPWPGGPPSMPQGSLEDMWKQINSAASAVGKMLGGNYRAAYDWARDNASRTLREKTRAEICGECPSCCLPDYAELTAMVADSPWLSRGTATKPSVRLRAGMRAFG